MPLNAPASNQSERILPPEGSHVARIYSLVEIGTVEGYQGKPQRKMRLTFELPQELHEFKEGEGEKPLVISAEYTLSMNEKSNLRGLVHSVVGKSLSDDEAEAYDLTQLVGKALIVTIEYKQSDKGTYANVKGTTPLMKGTEVPDQFNDSVLLTYEEFDKEVFENLPDFLKEKMRTTTEYAQAMEDPEAPPFDEEPPFEEPPEYEDKEDKEEK